MSTRYAALTMSAFILAAPNVDAQPERFELGQRLRAFENAWEKQTDAAARKRAVEPLVQATTAFFSFRMGEAGRALDQARFALESDQPVPTDRQWAVSLQLSPMQTLADERTSKTQRIQDVRLGKLHLKLHSFYSVDQISPDSAEWRVRLLAEKDGRILAEVRHPYGAVFRHTTLAWKDAPPGDHTVRLDILVGGEVKYTSDQTISLVQDLSQRLAALKKLPHEDAFRNIEGQTFGELRRIVQNLADGKTLETNYPAARLLAEAEALPEAIRKGESYYAWPRAGQHWLRIAAGANKETVRMFVPDKLAKDRPVPLVIALHGAGGSENMFFDGYGNGKIVKLCQERGWILVAPRLSPFAAPIKTEEMISEFASRWPIDKKRVFLIGHSMGAMQAVQIAQRIPKQIAGMAALGGGQKIDAEALVELPIFIGVGSRDFMLRNVKSLHESLTDAQAKSVDYREYPDLEHLVIVQQALPGVFAFFDGIIKGKK